eukprot:5826326-Pleurochrysis_carterae.AAC.5
MCVTLFLRIRVVWQASNLRILKAGKPEGSQLSRLRRLSAVTYTLIRAHDRMNTHRHVCMHAQPLARLLFARANPSRALHVLLHVYERNFAKDKH